MLGMRKERSDSLSGHDPESQQIKDEIKKEEARKKVEHEAQPIKNRFIELSESQLMIEGPESEHDLSY